MTSELKECPFDCGCTLTPAVEHDGYGGWIVRCRACGCCTTEAADEEVAIQFWNSRRAPEPAGREFAGMRIVVDESIPAGEVHMRSGDQCVIARFATPASTAAGDDGERRLHIATLTGIAKHIRAVPDYQKLVGDAECIEKAIGFLRRLSHRAGDHGAAEHGIERSTKATFVPCDCGCGRSCCAHCGVDVGFVQETPSAPVAGSGE